MTTQSITSQDFEADELAFLDSLVPFELRQVAAAKMLYAKRFKAPRGFVFQAGDAACDLASFDWFGPEAGVEGENLGIITRWTPDGGLEVTLDAVGGYLPPSKKAAIEKAIAILVEKIEGASK